MLKFLLPKTPFILKTALSHTLRLSPTSTKWDLRTELTVNILRDMLTGTPTSVTKQQRMTTRDPGVKGQLWVSKVKLAVSEEDDVRQLLFQAIKELGTGSEKWTPPEARPLEAEWTGHRSDPTITPQTPEPADLSEKQKYDALLQDTTSKVTVLYFHGGALYLLDPATYRPTTSRLAKETGGRVFSVRYRLAPQNPFPAALLDALTAYLSLLYPPPDAPHAPIPASEIVFAGDSAGGILCAALLQLLLHLHRTSSGSGSSAPTTRFHGQTVPIPLPLPAGVALVSPWLDITRSMPSIESLAYYDYLPPRDASHNSRFQPDEAWPVDPPRADLYCEGSALLHPLVSPLAAGAGQWRGAPPVFFSVGQEMLRDEGAVLARRLAGQGGKVVWREFEAMPHCFAMMLENLRESGCHWQELAGFCSAVVERGEGEVEAGAEFISAKTLQRNKVEFAELTYLSDGEVERLMREGRERLEVKAERGELEEPRPML
jgi:acetyl esterase/lipase